MTLSFLLSLDVYRWIFVVFALNVCTFFFSKFNEEKKFPFLAAAVFFFVLSRIESEMKIMECIAHTTSNCILHIVHLMISILFPSFYFVFCLPKFLRKARNGFCMETTKNFVRQLMEIKRNKKKQRSKKQNKAIN